MADEISNKTLAILVVAAIVVTLGGTMLVLKDGPSAQLTGFVTTQEGTASINISEVIDIELTDAVIDFGTGYVNDTGDKVCTMNSEGVEDAADCLGEWNDTVDSMTIINEGNVNILLTVAASAQADTWITGTSPSFKIKSTNDEASCTAGTAFGSYTEMSGSVTLCDSMKFNSAEDSLTINAEVSVPSDATPGARSSTLTFTASKA